MAIGVITGSGTDALPGLEGGPAEKVATAWGEAAVTPGQLAGVEILHVSRHGPGHERLSNHVLFQANVAALKARGARVVVGLTVCGAVDPGVELGTLIVFEDLHFPVNRLPGGEVCSFHLHPGDPERGHWIYDGPYAEPLRRVLVEGAHSAGGAVLDGGCYGHVDGPRFNTRAEIRSLALAGVTAVSQTGGPETVLCGEAELPFALVGYATDYANGVSETPTPMSTLTELMGRSTGVFAALLEHALPRLRVEDIPASGMVYRFE